MAAPQVQFRVTKQTDEAALLCVEELVAATKSKLTNVSFTLPHGIDGKATSLAELRANEIWMAVADSQSELANITVTLEKSIKFGLLREDALTDLLRITHNPATLDEPGRLFLVRLDAAARSAFKARYTHSTVSDSLEEEHKRHYEARDAELSRLETLSKKLIEDVATSLANQRERLQKEYDAKEDKLEAEHTARSNELSEHESKVADREKEIDDRSSTHVRREIREKLKAALKERTSSFGLSESTGKLGEPARLVLLVMMVIAGLVFGASTFILLLAAYPTGADSSTNWVLLVKSGLYFIAFATFGSWYVRDSNSWLRQHADEEFKLRRFDLDFDRASWVVEMAFEYHTETEGEHLPDSLLEKLTEGLFESSDRRDDRSPADHLASALLGSSSEIELEAGGNKIRLNKKGISKLKKEDAPG